MNWLIRFIIYAKTTFLIKNTSRLKKEKSRKKCFIQKEEIHYTICDGFQNTILGTCCEPRESMCWSAVI